MVEYEPRARRFTRAEYERLIDLGVFRPGEAIELIGGELMVAEPQGAPLARPGSTVSVSQLLP